MFGRAKIGGDPFEGTHAYRRKLRLRIEGLVALAMAVAACGLVAAMWLRMVGPALSQILFH